VRLARLLFEAWELVLIPEGKLRVGVAVSLPDDLRVQHPAVGQVRVGQGAAVLVVALPVEIQPDLLAGGHLCDEG
jgi:hypothetical protein